MGVHRASQAARFGVGRPAKAPNNAAADSDHRPVHAERPEAVNAAVEHSRSSQDPKQAAVRMFAESSRVAPRLEV
jgi:hypothetical protein